MKLCERRGEEELIKTVPTKEVEFTFPTPYQETSPTGDELWDELMPCKLFIIPSILFCFVLFCFVLQEERGN